MQEIRWKSENWQIDCGGIWNIGEYHMKENDINITSLKSRETEYLTWTYLGFFTYI